MRIPVGFALSTMAVLAVTEARAQDPSMFPPLPSPEEQREQAAPSPEPAPAPPPVEPPHAAFGAPGQGMISNGSVVGVSSTSYDASRAGGFAATVSPGFDYFIVRNLSLGLSLDLSYSDLQGYGSDGSLVETTTTTFSGGPRVGLNVPLGTSFSLYPRLSFGIEWARRHESLVSGSSLSIAGSPTGAAATTQTGPYVSLYVPLLAHLKPHFFVGFGPSIFRDFGRAQGGPDVGAQRTILGAGGVVGGYFGGAAAPPPSTEPGPRPAPRFGKEGQVVLTGSLDANAHWATYDGTGSSYTSVGASPGLDYFVANHVSIGAAIVATYTSLTGLNNGVSVTIDRTTVSLAPRASFEVPLGPSLSLYPSATIGFAYSASNERSGTTQNNPTETYVWIGAYVPLLVHLAPHFFVGFGPSVSHDLTHEAAYPNNYSYQNRLTSLGASLVVGGWL